MVLVELGGDRNMKHLEGTYEKKAGDPKPENGPKARKRTLSSKKDPKLENGLHKDPKPEKGTQDQKRNPRPKKEPGLEN
ncbi:uncharacterized protein LOC131695038 [Topomyia yanbarensis]|uniref:uncharacterized protein LOC131695038 n=1 Tax=Topomyia yanbarensis TaxID=2498891 RepID=UPI00273B873A|nr:uncharacterized protein LOC131695038 [Topomyia yanbarensis]